MEGVIQIPCKILFLNFLSFSFVFCMQWVVAEERQTLNKHPEWMPRLFAKQPLASPGSAKKKKKLHVARDTWQVGRAEHSLKFSASQLLRSGNQGILKIFPQRMSELLNGLVCDKGVCRTAPATPGLLKNRTGRSD